VSSASDPGIANLGDEEGSRYPGRKRPVFERGGLSASDGLIVLDIADGEGKPMKRFILKVASSSLSVLKAVLVKASKMMEDPPREMSVQWNKKIMRKLEIMRILVGKYLVLFGCAR
jgi:hypothetical protein